MKSRSSFALSLLIAATTVWASEPNPSDLVQQAHAVVAKHSDYRKGINLLQKANAVWQKNDVKSPEYLASLTYLATLYLAEDRRSGADLGISQRQRNHLFAVESSIVLASFTGAYPEPRTARG